MNETNAGQNQNPIYTLYYRQGSNHIQNKNFRFNGSLHAAMERGKKHCDTMSYRFMFVQPFISDLDREERFELGLKEPVAAATEKENK